MNNDVPFFQYFPVVIPAKAESIWLYAEEQHGFPLSRE
jgi:hypothetical protein